MKDKDLESVSQFLENFDDDTKDKLLNSLNEVDANIRISLSLILEFWAKYNQFNQNHLEDLVELVKARHYVLRKMK